MGIADDIVNAQSYETGVYLSPGFLGKVRITNIKENNGQKGQSLIVELDILESNSAADPVGAHRSIVYMKSLPAALAAAQRDLLCFKSKIAGTTLADTEALTKSDIQEMVGPDQVCAGLELTMETNKQKLKNPAKDIDPETGRPREWFTKVSFR